MLCIRLPTKVKGGLSFILSSPIWLLCIKIDAVILKLNINTLCLVILYVRIQDPTETCLYLIRLHDMTLGQTITGQFFRILFDRQEMIFGSDLWTSTATTRGRFWNDPACPLDVYRLTVL